MLFVARAGRGRGAFPGLIGRLRGDMREPSENRMAPFMR